MVCRLCGRMDYRDEEGIHTVEVRGLLGYEILLHNPCAR